MKKYSILFALLGLLTGCDFEIQMGEVECDNPCPDEQVCDKGECVDRPTEPECENNDQCSDNKICCLGKCVIEDECTPNGCGGKNNGDSCGNGGVCCNEQCVDSKTDPKNCGECGKKCNNNDDCENGFCKTKAPECSEDTRICDENENAIKSCIGGRWEKVACKENETCNIGECKCNEGFDKCGTDTCINLSNTYEHCGSCNHTCEGDEICTGNVCKCGILTCNHQQFCNDNKCWEKCGEREEGSKKCNGNTILVCQDGYWATSDACIDSTCVAGLCVDKNSCENKINGDSCGNGGVCCNEQCVDSKTDPKNCGECGKKCNNNDDCENGFCKTKAPECSEDTRFCVGNAIKSCIDGNWKTEDCNENEICKAGSCMPKSECNKHTECSIGQECWNSMCHNAVKGLYFQNTVNKAAEVLNTYGIRRVAIEFKWSEWAGHNVCNSDKIKLEYRDVKYCVDKRVADLIKEYTDNGISVTAIVLGNKCDPSSEKFQINCIAEDNVDNFGIFAGFLAHYFNGSDNHGTINDFVILKKANECVKKVCNSSDLYYKIFSTAKNSILEEQKDARVFISLGDPLVHKLGEPIINGDDGTALQFLKKFTNELDTSSLEWNIAYDLSGTELTPIRELPSWLYKNLKKPPQDINIILFNDIENDQIICNLFKNVLAAPNIETLFHTRDINNETDGFIKAGNIENPCGFDNLPYTILWEYKKNTPLAIHYTTQPELGDFYTSASWKLLREKPENTEMNMLFECKLTNRNYTTVTTKRECGYSKTLLGPLGYAYKEQGTHKGLISLYKCFGAYDTIVSGNCPQNHDDNKLLGYVLPNDQN